MPLTPLGELSLASAVPPEPLTSSLGELFGREKRLFPGQVFWNGATGMRQLLPLDMNKDGQVDLVGVGSYQSALFYNGGRGAFARSEMLEIRTDLPAVLGDVNGDTLPDLIFLDYKGTLLVGLQNTAGGFAKPITNSATGMLVLADGDLNADGRVDIVARNQEGIHIFAGQANGSVMSLGHILDGPSLAHSLMVADFSGDGKLDLVWMSGVEQPGLKVALGNGDGSFKEASFIPLSQAAVQFLAGDLDGDGYPDIVAGLSPSPGLAILRGAGEGRFKDPEILSLDEVDQIDKLDLLDLDHNGTKEIIVQFFHNGATQRRILSIEIGKAGDKKIRTVYRGDGVFPMEFVELNGDEWLDAVAPVEGGVEVLMAQNGGQLSGSSRLEPSGGASNTGGLRGHLAAADIDGNGSIDLATPYGNIFFGGPAGVFTEVKLPDSYNLASQSSDVTLLDVDQDKDLDVLFTVRSSQFSTNDVLRVYIQDQGRTFTRHTDYQTGPQPMFLAVADLNQDQKPDVVTLNNVSSPAKASISVLLGNGDGTFRKREDYPLPGVTNKTLLARYLFTADVTGDGAADVVVISQALSFYTGFVTVFQNNGGSPLLTARPPVQVGTNRFADAAALADFNHDGKPDLVLDQTVGSNHELACYFGDGTGRFTNGPVHHLASSPQQPRSPRLLHVDDVDRDGDLDLVSSENELVTVYFGRGTGDFPIEQSFYAGLEPYALTTADLDGDGWPELINARGYLTITPNQAVSSEVKVFRQLASQARDQVLSSSEIERIRLAFDPYHREVNQIVFIDWPAELQRRFMAWLARFLPAALAHVNGQPATLIVSQPMLDEINTLLDDVESRSSPALKSVFQSERQRLRHFQDFAGMNFDQVVARLDLGEQLRILKGVFLQKGFGLLLSGGSSSNFSLWRATSLGPTNSWEAVPQPLHDTQGTNALLIDPQPPTNSALYRVGRPVQP